jgi:microcompartment protein CcmK/EutM
MRIAHVIGTVTLNRLHPSFTGARLKLAVPMTLDQLRSEEIPRGESLVVYDDRGASVGSRIMLSEGAEAAQAFRPESKPVDAYNAGILDDVTLTLDVVESG